jgi:hypothetical protein
MPEAEKSAALYPKNVRIPIIAVTGEPNSGKTLFALNIDPWTRDESKEPPLKLWDFEGSAEPYKDGLNFDWVDAGREVEAYSAEAAFDWWHTQLLGTPHGRYRVLGVDTMDDILKGSVDWVRNRPKTFGRTPKQYEKASSMFLWPDVKAFWKKILFVEARERCQTFVMTFHLKNEWKGDNPTGRRIPEGLDVMTKLATLYLWLDRTPRIKGTRSPRIPRGIVQKERLVRFGESEEDDRPILPPQLPKATGTAIRDYINNPPDYNNLSVEERRPDQSLSEDDKLVLQAGIAQSQAIVAQSTLSHIEIMKASAAEQGASMQDTQQPVKEPEPSYGQGTGEPCGKDAAAEIKFLLGDLNATVDDAKAILAKRGVSKFEDIPLGNAEKLIANLRGKVAEQGAGEMLEGASETLAGNSA